MDEDMIKLEFAENPLLEQEKFSSKKITEKNKHEEEKHKVIKDQTSLNKNTRTVINKSQLCLKNDKQDIEFIDIKPNTGSPSQKRISSKDTKYRTHRSSPTSYRHSRSSNRRKSKIPSEITPRSRLCSFRHSRSRSRSPYYNRYKYSSHRSSSRRYRSRERGETYKKPIYTPPNAQPMHSMSGYVSRHSRPSMSYAEPTLYSPNIDSVEYHKQKKRNISKRTSLIQEPEKAVKKNKSEMEKKLASYEKYPENNPFHQDEWKNDQSQRYKQLQMESKNPNKMDIKPEWMLHEVTWSKNIQEMKSKHMNENMKKIKNKIVGDINTDNNSSELPSTDCNLYCPSVKDKKLIIGSKHSRHNIPVSEVLDKDSDIVVNKLYNDTKPRVNCVSPINSDSEHSINKCNPHNKSKEKIEIKNPLNVFTVLKQLSVLERQLGLLEPKIIDLLSKSLIMEKNEPKSSIGLLTPENCAIFETVKEKLKGQLFANAVKMSLVNVTKLCICNIDKLLQLNSTLTSIFMPIILPGPDVIDKKTIAQQITRPLLAEGTVDLSQNYLKTNAVVNKTQSGDNAKNLLTNINNGGVIKTTYEEVDEKEKTELSHTDIFNLLNNFRALETYEQDALITYLKNLGEKKPDEVKKFRKYINLGPFNLKEVNSMFIHEDDDDDSYELIEVCKAINDKVGEQKDEDMNKMRINFKAIEEKKEL